MPSPNTLFGFIIATLLGAAFHLVMGGDARRLALFLLAGWLGFSLGQILGTILEINLLSIGTLRIVPAVIGALTALLIAHILTNNRMRKRPLR